MMHTSVSRRHCLDHASSSGRCSNMEALLIQLTSLQSYYGMGVSAYYRHLPSLACSSIARRCLTEYAELPHHGMR